MDLGSILREARDARELTERQIALRTGFTVQAISRWERGDRPVRSDVADRILAACGSDVRVTLVDRHQDVDALLTRLQAQTVPERMGVIPGLLRLNTLDELQQTGHVVFTGAWAAAALGLPPLHQVGGMLVSGAHARVAAILRVQSPVRTAEDGPWGASWDDAVLTRHPHAQWHSMLIGDFVLEVVAAGGLQVQVPTPQGPWQVVDPARLVPQHVDATVLARWRELLEQA